MLMMMSASDAASRGEAGDGRARAGEGRSLVAISVVNAKRKTRGEQAPRHPASHNSQSDNCYARF